MAKTLKIQSSKEIISNVDLIVNHLYRELNFNSPYVPEFHKVIEDEDNLSPILYKVVISFPFKKTILFTKDYILYKSKIEGKVNEGTIMIPDNLDTNILDLMIKDLSEWSSNS